MIDTIRIVAGYDFAESAGYHTFCQSIIDNTEAPVSIMPLTLKAVSGIYNAGQRDGTNQFIYTRFLIPHLMNYSGWALFVDGADMLCVGDVSELWALRDPFKAAQVVKHEYQTKHPRKYVGSQIEAKNDDYPRKNWSSVMLMNCAHDGWRRLDVSEIGTSSGGYLHRFQFMDDRYVGDLPKEWNWLADEYGENPAAKLLHWTAGMPGFHNYAKAPHAAQWHAAYANVKNVANGATAC